LTKPFLTSFLLGFFTILASPPFNLFFVLITSFSLFAHFLYHCSNFSKNKHLLTISLFFFGYYIAHFHWFVLPLFTDIKTYFLLIPFALFGLPFLMTIFVLIPYYIFFNIINKMNFHFSKKYYVFILISSFVIGEFFRANIIFEGFPWMLIGHFVNNLYLLQILKFEFVNIDLFSLFTLFLVFFLYFLIHFKKTSFLVLSLWFINFLYGVYVLHFEKHNLVFDKNLSILGSQPNVKPTVKYNYYDSNKKLEANFAKVSYAKVFPGKTLVLLPESAVDFQFNSRDNISSYLSYILPNHKSILMTGSFFIDRSEGKIYNSIHFIDKEAEIVNIYHKQKLVPFGEYLPLRRYLPSFLNPIAGSVDITSGDKWHQSYLKYYDMPVIFPIICYESIFHDLVKQRIDYYHSYTRKSELPLIVNLTNDAWMRWSIGGLQHFKMSKFTAVRADAYLARVSNNGISAVIDNFGRVLQRTKFNSEDTLIFTFM
jgi:apolipoprotein N-acyltransferase